VLLVVAMLFISLYVSFNFRLVSRTQEAQHTLEVQHYMKLANDARKEVRQPLSVASHRIA
jgi:Ca2+/Na+ antiporter